MVKYIPARARARVRARARARENGEWSGLSIQIFENFETYFFRFDLFCTPTTVYASVPGTDYAYTPCDQCDCAVGPAVLSPTEHYVVTQGTAITAARCYTALSSSTAEEAQW